MTPFETIEIKETVAACAGGPGGAGHPKVYLNLMPSWRVECPYCSRVFINPSVAQSADAAPEQEDAAHG